MKNQEVIDLTAIKQLDQKFRQSIPNRPYYRINNSGCRCTSDNLTLAVFRISIYVGLSALKQNESWIIMITASHNPPADNGIKIGKFSSPIVSVEYFQNIQRILNNDDEFIKFLDEEIQNLHNSFTHKNLYLGRDCRESSPQISRITKQALELCNIQNIIDIGICSTPELWSFSQYLQQNVRDIKIKKKSETHQMFIQQILSNFENAWSAISDSQPKQKMQILFDFSNGSGAISYKPYHDKLSQYFTITTINDNNFANPNHKCGAAYIHKSWQQVCSRQQYKQYDLCVFFDGDSDRVIFKIKDSDQCFDGDSLTVLYINLLNKIILNLPSKIYSQLCLNLQETIKPKVVNNTQSNLGLVLQMKKQNIQIQMAQVGMHNLFAIAETKNLSIFFQPNGHGGIYMSSELVKFLQNKLSQNNSEIILLYSIFKILRNNCRGYALHNFLVFSLSTKYLYESNLTLLKGIYHKNHQLKSQIQVKTDRATQFKNSESGHCLLIEPKDLINKIKLLCDFNPEYQINIRRSATQFSLIRVSIQGKYKEICQKLKSQVSQMLIPYQQQHK